MGSLSIWHWLIVLAIVALVFGTKKLGNIGHDLGSAVRGFKKAMNDGDQEEQALRKQLPPAGTTDAPPPGTARDAEFHDTTSTGARQDDRRS